MGNSGEKQSLTAFDRDYLGQHTSVTMDEVVRYENFLHEHPNGQITKQEFR